MIAELFEDSEQRMKGAIRALDEDLATYRTGRASPRMLDKIVAEMYGVSMPLQQLATVAAPEAGLLVIRPFDANSIPAIERAIITSNLGLNPSNDGAVIRLAIPRLTEERRTQLSKQVSGRVEDAKVAVRNVRRDCLNDIRDMENEKMITEDESRKGQEDLQDLTNKHTDQIDKLGKEKIAEVMEV